jgi:hypothetical protein
MGNYLTKKELKNSKKSFHKKTDSDAGISNLPGIAAPPKFESNVTFRKKNEKEITKNDLIKYSQRQSQIDTLPRFTAGSAQVIESIASIKESTSRNIDDDDDDDTPIYSKSINRSTITETRTTSSKNALSDMLEELKNKNKSQVNNNNSNKITKSTPPKVMPANNKPIKPKIEDNNIPSVTDNENDSEDYVFVNQRKLNNSKRNLAPSSLLINLKNKSSSSSHVPNNKNEPTVANQPNDNSSKNFKKLNKKRHKVYSNLVSLNKIENNQKSKILEQERLLKIQNMKLQDALIIEKSLVNFDDYYTKHEDFERDRQQTKFEKNHTNSRSSTKPSIIQKRIPIKFPSIITRYEPRQSMESVSAPRSSYYSSNYYEPRRSRSMIITDGLYLQTTQDIVDSKGRILSTNKSSRYLGESTDVSQSGFQPNFQIQKSISPEIEINNHKYEILTSNRKLSASDLKSNELNNIISIIEKLEKNEADDYHNYSRENKTNGFINHMNYNCFKKTNSSSNVNDLNEPSFTIPENIYKSIMTKKAQKSRSFKDNYGKNNTGYFRPILRPEEAHIIKSQPKYFTAPDSNSPTNNNNYASQFYAEL